MDYKALFLDVDDTLVGNDKIISKGNLDAVREAIDSGVYVTIATGRGYLGCTPIWKELGVRGPVIVYGGAMVVDTDNDEILYQGDIDASLIAEALEAARVWDLHAHIYQGDTVVFEKQNEFAKLYTKFLNLPTIVDPAIREKSWNNVPKVLVYAPPEIEVEMIKRFKDRFEGRLEVAASKPGFIELNRFGTNKGTTMLRICDMLGISREETVAVGDNTLDMEMIKMAGLGVCVGNGQQIVKDIADVIAPDSDKDGVGWVIRKYILNKD